MSCEEQCLWTKLLSKEAVNVNLADWPAAIGKLCLELLPWARAVSNMPLGMKRNTDMCHVRMYFHSSVASQDQVPA